MSMLTLYKYQCFAGCHNVSVLQAVGSSVSVLHALTFVSVLQALTMSVCCMH